MKPLLDESEIQWGSIVDPKPEDPQAPRFLNVTGTYKHITYTGTVCIDRQTDAQIMQSIAYLKSGIAHHIANALDEEEMMRRAKFTLQDRKPVIGSETGQFARVMAGVLDDEPNTVILMAVVEPPEGLSEEDLEEEIRRTKMLMWTEWRQKEMV